MPQTIAKLVKYAGGRDVWGGHGVFLCNYTGPASYFNGGGAGNLNGEIIDSVGALTELGAANTPLRNIDAIIGSNTVSGTFRVEASPSAAGPVRRWFIRWYVIDTAVAVANAVNLSAETAILTIIGG